MSELQAVLTRIADAVERFANGQEETLDYIRNRDLADARRREEISQTDSEWTERMDSRLELDRRLLEIQERSLAKQEELDARLGALGKEKET